jgi:hypothetical protein
MDGVYEAGDEWQTVLIFVPKNINFLFSLKLKKTRQSRKE